MDNILFFMSRGVKYERGGQLPHDWNYEISGFEMNATSIEGEDWGNVMALNLKGSNGRPDSVCIIPMSAIESIVMVAD